MEIFHKEYSGESIVDMERDIAECLDEATNPAMAEVLKDEYGIPKGRFVVRVQWIDDPACCCCGTRENLHKDGWYGYRCNSTECVPF
jgi:hypothetical protein